MTQKDTDVYEKASGSRESMQLKEGLSVRSGAWFGDREIALNFPANWEVKVLAPRETPKVEETQIEAAFAKPIGTPTIAEMARGKNSAAIVVDDLSRPTPAADLIPFVLRELSQAGIPKDEIRFVVGVGSHRPLNPGEIAKKVGPGVAAEYEVTNHAFMSGGLRALGNLDDGTPVYINPVVADADFKICVGGIYPHEAAGFGGGAKLILPGVAGFATIFCFHHHYAFRRHGAVERSGSEPDMRDTAEAVARRLGLDVIVNAVTNGRREIVGVFVGDFVEAHREGAQFARETYNTDIPDEIRRSTDLVVINSYPLDADSIQLGKSLWVRDYFDRAYAIAISPCSDGICYHGIRDGLDYTRFQKQRAALEPMELPAPGIGKREQLLVYSEHYPVEDFYQDYSDNILFRDWDTPIRMLAEKLPSNARVAVFPCAPIQLPTNRK